MPIKIYAAPVMAAAYRGVAPTLLKHAVADQAFAAGRLHRSARTPFCDPKINAGDDSELWEHANNITCPRCQQIVQRLMETGGV